MPVHSPPWIIAQDEDEPIEILSNRSTQGAIMNETPGTPAGSRRNEDIALDLMRFIALSTGYGKTGAAGAGFTGGGTPSKPEDYANHLLELYGRCLDAVERKK
jgi:hypothetical protein